MPPSPFPSPKTAGNQLLTATKLLHKLQSFPLFPSYRNGSSSRLLNRNLGEERSWGGGKTGPGVAAASPFLTCPHFPTEREEGSEGKVCFFKTVLVLLFFWGDLFFFLIPGEITSCVYKAN